MCMLLRSTLRSLYPEECDSDHVKLAGFTSIHTKIAYMILSVKGSKHRCFGLSKGNQDHNLNIAR